ncbi:MAG: sigma-70 family RNA polymerase sigma factor [Betaproteobacteria bacterium]
MLKAGISSAIPTAANDERAPPGVTAGARSIDDRARSLLKLVSAGDQSAFEQFYRLLSRRVYAFAMRMTNQAEAADEIMVDTMHEVWRAAGRFRGDSQVSTWVLGIARNKALVALRSRPAEHADIGDFADILESGFPDGAAVLAQRQEREGIQRCMRQLSMSHRECLHLAYFEDMSMREIATLLGVPEGTVKSRLSHARMQLAASYSAMVDREQMPR